MLELILALMVLCLVVSIGFYKTYAYAKSIVNTDTVLDIADEMLQELTQNVEMQKKVYFLGVILGNGIKKGIGIGGKGGKFKFEDLIGQALQGFLTNFMGGNQQPQAEKTIQEVSGLGDLTKGL